jgi:hypothetical protein
MSCVRVHVMPNSSRCILFIAILVTRYHRVWFGPCLSFLRISSSILEKKWDFLQYSSRCFCCVEKPGIYLSAISLWSNSSSVFANRLTKYNLLNLYGEYIVKLLEDYKLKALKYLRLWHFLKSHTHDTCFMLVSTFKQTRVFGREKHFHRYFLTPSLK